MKLMGLAAAAGLVTALVFTPVATGRAFAADKKLEETVETQGKTQLHKKVEKSKTAVDKDQARGKAKVKKDKNALKKKGNSAIDHASDKAIDRASDSSALKR